MKYLRIILGSFLALNAVVFLSGATEGELRVVSIVLFGACCVAAFYVWPRNVWPRRLLG